MEATLVAAAVPAWLAVGGLTTLALSLVREHGRTLVAQEELERRIATTERALSGEPEPADGKPPGLAVGTPAPVFALPDLDGNERALGEFAGRPFVLLFVRPTCPFSKLLAPRLPFLPGDALPIVAVSAGDRDANAELAEEHEWSFPVLLQDDLETWADYKIAGTPSAYLIDAEGRIGSPLAVSGDAVLALATGADPATGRVRHEGLPRGSSVPDFTASDIHGAKRSLSEFRGKRVLLVFSDTSGCLSCDGFSAELARLQEAHGERLQIVVVARGERDLSRARAEYHGFAFPLLVQEDWEIAKKLRTFVVPAAYLIDERGRVENDVALGMPEILQLV